jgi:hypothetical protein
MKSPRLWIALFALLIALVFIATVTTPIMAQKDVTGAGRWTIDTYVGDEGPFSLKTKPLPGGGVFVDFFNTPDRAVLFTDSPSYKRFILGELTGKTLSADIAIEATPGATFNYYDTGGDTPASVRFYFQKPNAPGCPAGWHPERPDCEAQYWWSNPVSISLNDLASLGNAGTTLTTPLVPSSWSDRDGHMGDSDAAHSAWFNLAVANVNKIGLSFGGGNNFAYGCGVDAPATAKFKLLAYVAK